MQKNLLRAFIIFCLVIGATGLLVIAVGSHMQARQVMADSSIEPEPFPPLRLKNLQGEDVDLLRLYPGKTLLVNYWATWCPPCISEIPSLMALKKERQSADFDVVFISLDFPKDSKSLIQLMKRFHLEEIDTLYMADATQWSDLQGRGLPITVLVTPNGNIISRMVGAIDWSGEAGAHFLSKIPESE